MVRLKSILRKCSWLHSTLLPTDNLIPVQTADATRLRKSCRSDFPGDPEGPGVSGIEWSPEPTPPSRGQRSFGDDAMIISNSSSTFFYTIRGSENLLLL